MNPLAGSTALMTRAVIALGCLTLLTAALAADDIRTPVPDGEWLPLSTQSLDIAAGAALDFSALVPARAAGSDGALTVGSDGKLHLGTSSDPRFNCGMLTNGPNMTWAMPTHQQADDLAVQLRRHGYNLVRFHYMDGRLRQGAPGGQGVNPENLDRYFYLLAALKKNGIYWMLDVVTSPNGDRTQGYGVLHSVDDMRTRVNFDPQARADWVRMLTEVYLRKNPYTGVAPLADPALAFVVGANENSLTFSGLLSKDGPFPKGLSDRFDAWVRSRNTSTMALAKSVPDLTPDEQSDKARIAMPSGWRATGPRSALFREFISSLEVDTYKWMTSELRKGGFNGPVLAYPEWYPGVDNRTRSALPITDLHAYVGEVSNFARGAPLKLTSMTQDSGLNDWLANAGGRWLDRPLVLSEYGSPFPNPNRRDSGIMFPAVSAFQDYSAICRMATMSVEPEILPDGPKVKPIMPYSVGIDPISRAAETLSTLLFYRRDVAPATGAGVAVPFGPADMANADSAFIPRPIKRAALLVKFGLIPPDKVDSLPSGTQIVPLSAPPQTKVDKAIDRLIALTGDPQRRTETLISTLFQRGLLPKGNRTSVADGIYESRTGELLLDQRNGVITVTTPRTQAVNSMAAVNGVTLRDMTLLSADDGVLVAASAIDGKPLKDSNRILLILAGDARNSGMAMVGGGDQRTLLDWGRLPILLKRVTAKIALRPAQPFNGRFSVLALNGQPISSSAVRSDAKGAVNLTLDTAAVRSAPTTYFLLERDGAAASSGN